MPAFRGSRVRRLAADISTTVSSHKKIGILAAGSAPMWVALDDAFQFPETPPARPIPAGRKVRGWKLILTPSGASPLAAPNPIEQKRGSPMLH
ncbi:hypothetical protein GGTG_05906 [Gaeumannomyces tritici R3-111a-1]|uniref:Uncharacterized protein n=1 Tax=Gaeumannomyces tritici (strain R3-111a-1) TaxID=644352 RepID=J3NX99_GAET3|nr:hypothetical protein GGTG_05906 [Gaeumannomyces tritici R3-111a-1]EJT75981.1 hypothetical protein GGTG_05906 [Gaeumannomyces tritici R3-111a-1]